MWYSCSKRATTGCKATACVVATSEEQEDGSLLWSHRFEKVSTYEVQCNVNDLNTSPISTIQDHCIFHVPEPAERVSDIIQDKLRDRAQRHPLVAPGEKNIVLA